MKKNLLFLVCLLFTMEVFSQFNLQFHYSERNPEAERILRNIKTKKKYTDYSSVEKELQKIVTIFHQQHYLSFSIDSIHLDSSVYHAYLFFGKPLLIEGIKVEGMSEAIKNNLKIPSPPPSMQDVYDFCETTISYLENNGYPFASARFEGFEQDSLKTYAKLSVTMNPYIVWDSIIVKGNAKIAKSFLYAYFDIKKGKMYKETTVQQIPDLIQSLSYVEETQAGSVSFSKEKAALYVYLNKRNTNQFDGFLGVIPESTKSGKTLITGNINLLLNNTMTLGERISLRWKTPDNLSQNLDIELTFPYLFYTRFGLDLSFHLQKTDTSYLQLNFSPGLQYYFHGTNYIKLYYQYNNTRLIATKHLLEIIALPEHIDFDLHLYGLEVFYRKLDYVFNPRKGYSLLASAAIGNRNIIINNNIPKELYADIEQNTFHIKSMADVSLYLPIKRRWTWMNRLQGAYLHGKNLFENELFRLGGSNTLRGFIEQSMYASSYALFTTEIRFLFSKNSYINAFFDAGWYEKKSTGGYVNDIPFGFGLGLAFDTKAGVFSLSYALGKQFNNPISFKTGVVSFGYIALF